MVPILADVLTAACLSIQATKVAASFSTAPGATIDPIIGINFGIQLGGTILVETVFARPGMGSLLISSIYQRDYPQVQALVVVFATSIVLVNVAVDVLYAAFDPRVRA